VIMLLDACCEAEPQAEAAPPAFRALLRVRHPPLCHKLLGGENGAISQTDSW
jgi:hypothetical protein